MKDLVKSKYYKPVACGVLTAIVTVATMFLSIPIPGFSGAYMNAGDAAVYLCAYMIGGWWGAACAGIGSALADIFAWRNGIRARYLYNQRVHGR